MMLFNPLMIMINIFFSIFNHLFLKFINVTHTADHIHKNSVFITKIILSNHLNDDGFLSKKVKKSVKSVLKQI